MNKSLLANERHCIDKEYLITYREEQNGQYVEIMQGSGLMHTIPSKACRLCHYAKHYYCTQSVICSNIAGAYCLDIRQLSHHGRK